MKEIQLKTAEQVETNLLDTFLRRMYPPLKSNFLIQYGGWWHRTKAHQLIVQVGEQIAGYCAVIPTKIWSAGEVRSALWWVDLVIAPEFRGLGLQTIFDQRVRKMSDLLLGFPNPLAAKIHKKHLWGVRDDMRIMMLPLQPLLAKSVRNAQGKRGAFLRMGAWGLTPLAAIWRAKLSKVKISGARKVEGLDAAILSDIFMRTKDVNSTWRDENYFRWRYGSAPHAAEYDYYVFGESSHPSHYLISRCMTQEDGTRHTRILDIFGDFSDNSAVEDLFNTAIQDAITQGSVQVTILTSRTQLQAIAQRLGFLLSTPVNFCWTSPLPQVMSALGQENYWTLADSDNDAPD